jgi:hypothetical protein
MLKVKFFDYKLSIFLSLFLFLFLSIFYFYPEATSPSVDLNVENYKIGEKVSPGWSKVCMFGKKELPSTVIGEYSSFPCEAEFDVSVGSVVMIYYYENKQCELLKFSGYFLSESDTATRCFDPVDTEYLDFYYENNIIKLRSK